MRQDESNKNAAIIKGLINIIPISELKKQNFSFFEDFQSVSPSNSSEYNIYPDVLSRQMFLISKKVKEIFDIFEPYLQYHEFCIVDYNNKQREYYYLPTLETVEVSSKFKTIKESFGVEFLEYPNDKLNFKGNLFSVINSESSYTIVSLPLAEFLLNHDLSGIEIVRIRNT